MKNMTDEQIGRVLDIWYAAMKYAEDFYMQMIEAGATPQIARSVLPNSTKTELVITTNYREWRHILKLRTAKDAHPQIREVCLELLKELKEKIPVIFDDIVVDD
jgi:thymidylate synthase (FAD)